MPTVYIDPDELVTVFLNVNGVMMLFARVMDIIFQKYSSDLRDRGSGIGDRVTPSKMPIFRGGFSEVFQRFSVDIFRIFSMLGSGRPGFGFGRPRQARDLTF